MDVLFGDFAPIGFLIVVGGVGVVSGVTRSQHHSFLYRRICFDHSPESRCLISEIFLFLCFFDFAAKLNLGHEAVIDRLNHVGRSLCLPGRSFIDFAILFLPFIGFLLSIPLLEPIQIHIVVNSV